LNNICVI